MNYRFFSVALLAVSVSACTGPVIIGSTAAGMYATSPNTPPPADTADQIPPHEDWCYSTAGYAECYAHPQAVAPERLVNVNPQSAYPVDLAAYRRALKSGNAPAAPVPVTATDQPVTLQPIAAQAVDRQQPANAHALPPDIQEERATLKEEIRQDNAIADTQASQLP